MRAPRCLGSPAMTSGEQDVVELAWPGQSKGIERVGDGEDDVEIRHGQQLALALLEPLLAGLGLTARTMPVPARMPDHVTIAAMSTFIEMTAEGRSTAERDGA